MMDWKQTVLTALFVLMAVTSATAPALGAANATQTGTAAELDVEQPRFVTDPVGVSTDNGSRVYLARGQYLEIQPKNFNSTAVTSFSVREDEATLQYDKTDGEYVLNNQGNAGTYHLRWTASEANGSRTYTAAIRVVKANYAHVGQDRFSSLKSDAKRGGEIISTFERAGDPDEPTSQKIEFSTTVLNFKHSPFSAFTGQYMALQTVRFLTPAGWVDLGITIALVYLLTRGLYSTIARLRKQLEKEEQISRREDQQYLSMFKTRLAGQQMSDVDGIDDHQAAVLEERLGTNLWTALKNFWTVWGADSLKRMYSDAMGAVGYAVRVTRDDRGDVTDVTVLDPSDDEVMADGGDVPDELTGTTDTVGLASAPEDVLDAMEWEQIDDRIFQKNPEINAVDHLMVANREEPGDLISDLNISLPEDFQSRQNFMEAIGRVLQSVIESDFTDENGYPREDRAVLNNVMAFTTIMEQEHDVPLDLWWRACVWNADGLSRGDEAESVLSDITDAGSLMDDDDVGGGSVGS